MSSVIASDSSKSLRRQFSWTLPANAIYGASNLLLLVVLNKLGGTAVAGEFSWVLAVIAPIFMCANLRFSTVLASDMRSEFRISDYFYLRASLLLAAMAAVVLYIVVSGNTQIACLLLVVALSKSIEAFSDLCCGLQQRIERMERIAFSLMANGIAMAALFAVIFFVTRNLAYAAVGLLVARVTVLLSYDIPMARIAAKQSVFRKIADNAASNSITSMARMRRLLLAGAPLGITAALMSLTTNVPRYIIPEFFDKQTLGLFVSIAVVLQAGTLIFRAIELPAIPRLARLLDRRDRVGFWKLLHSLFAIFSGIGLAGCVVSLLIGPQLLVFVFNNQFRTLGGVLALLTLATSITQIAGMVESALIAARMTRVQVPMHLLTTVSCLLLCLWLIPAYELYGAVLALGICRIPLTIIGVLLLRQKLAPGRSSPNLAVAIETVNERQRTRDAA